MPGIQIIPLDINRMEELWDKPRPPQIVALKEQIEGETRALELRISVAGPGSVNRKDIDKIVGMKLELDHLYGLWTLGKLK